MVKDYPRLVRSAYVMHMSFSSLFYLKVIILNSLINFSQQTHTYNTTAFYNLRRICEWRRAVNETWEKRNTESSYVKEVISLEEQKELELGLTLPPVDLISSLHRPIVLSAFWMNVQFHPKPMRWTHHYSASISDNSDRNSHLTLQIALTNPNQHPTCMIYVTNYY